MIGWGAVATAFAGLTNNPLHLYGLRFLLGFMEAGAFPWCGTPLQSSPFRAAFSEATGKRIQSWRRFDAAVTWSHIQNLNLLVCRGSMWAYLTLFYASGPDLAVAWSFIAAAQPLAQVRCVAAGSAVGASA